MRDRIVRYARRLEGLSTTELARGAEKLLSRERRYTAALIAHLAEISRRKGYLELGYKSLFDYCVRRLHLGKNSVWNRTQVANVSRRFPQVLEHLAEGKLSLSSLGVLARHLNEDNVEGLLAQAEGKTKDEVKEIVAAFDQPAFLTTRLLRHRMSRPGLRQSRRSDPHRAGSTPPVGSPTLPCQDTTYGTSRRCLVRNAGSPSETSGRVHDQTKAGAPPGIS